MTLVIPAASALSEHTSALCKYAWVLPIVLEPQLVRDSGLSLDMSNHKEDHSSKLRQEAAPVASVAQQG